jgi:hypothetical protein
MYVHNDFVQPGYHKYYMIVPNGFGGFNYKKHFVTFVKPRNEEIILRPLQRAIQDEEKGADDIKADSAIGKEWKFEDKFGVENLFRNDCEKWTVPEELVNEENMDIYLDCFKDNLQYFFGLYRNIAVDSD